MQTEFPERYITLGLKIAYYRKKAGLTQEVLAKRIGKSVNFVGQVEGTGMAAEKEPSAASIQPVHLHAHTRTDGQEPQIQYFL